VAIRAVLADKVYLSPRVAAEELELYSVPELTKYALREGLTSLDS
jgi:hypothetical protein